jgi:hypothetical protein
MNQKKVMALEIARRLEQRGLIDAAAHWYALANQVSVSLADSPPNPKRRLLSHGQNIGKEDRSPVGINPGTTPWSTVGGRARVNLATGRVSFDVDGLVLNGGNATGTPGGVDQVEGSLICDAGQPDQTIFTTLPVPLDARGNADFSGHSVPIPGTCTND